jgi:predicted peptidase
MLCAAAAATLSTNAYAKKMDKPTGFLFETISKDGVELKSATYVPRNYDPGKKWPLIVFLHGAGESGADGSKQIIQGIGSAVLWNPEKWPFIILFPQKPEIGRQWEEYDGAVMALVERAKKDYNIDASRIYLTGLSQGGHGSWVIGSKHPDVWAAVAPICGYGAIRGREGYRPGPREFTGTADEIAAKLKSIPVWAFHGEADSVVPIAATRELVEALKAAGGNVKFTTYPGVDHNSWDKAYREEPLGEWLLAQKRK